MLYSVTIHDLPITTLKGLIDLLKTNGKTIKNLVLTDNQNKFKEFEDVLRHIDPE